MAYYLRTTRIAYDNIAVGSATGRERTAGTVTSPLPTGGERWKTSEGGVSTHTTATALNRLITTTGGVTTLHPRELLG